MSVTALLIIAALAEGFLHYFPWRLVLGKELPRPAAYTLGVLGFAAPYGTWLIERGRLAEAFVLGGVLIVAGGTVLTLYALDWTVLLAWKYRETLQREEALQRMVEEKYQDGQTAGL